MASSRGKKSFHSGQKYQHSIYEKMCKILINNVKYNITEVQGAGSGPDIIINNVNNRLNIGIEVKNKGAFEGASKKLEYINDSLGIKEDCIHKDILKNIKLYNGHNLPWYEGKKAQKDYNEKKHIFDKDIYIDVEPDMISKYYKNRGTYYIIIENKGLYHTGEDVLKLDVPYFICNDTKLRIRSSKHKKNKIPTDITAALHYNKKNLKKSQYDLDNLPNNFTYC